MTEEEKVNLIAAQAFLSEPFPKEAIQRRKGGGGTMFDYVEAHTVIRRLNGLVNFGLTWDWKVIAERITEGQGQKTMIVRGALSITGLGVREGYGVQVINDRGGEDLVKGASSDALKKAATLFGVAIDLYGPDYEATDEQAGDTATTQERRPTAAAPSSAGNKATVAAGQAESEAAIKLRCIGLLDRLRAEQTLPWPGGDTANSKVLNIANRLWPGNSYQKVTNKMLDAILAYMDKLLAKERPDSESGGDTTVEDQGD